MCENYIPAVDFYGKLNSSIREAGSVAAFAARHGIDARHVYETQSAEVIHDDVVNAFGMLHVERFPLLENPRTLLTRNAVYEKLNSFVRECGTQRAAAEKLGVSEQHLSNVRHKRRGVLEILGPLGFGRPVHRFLPAQK